MTGNDQHEVVLHMHEAVNHLLMVLVRLEGLPAGAVPDDAIDMALLSSVAYQEARQGFRAALLRVDDREVLLAVEEAVNALLARAAEVGYRVGVRARAG